MVVQTSLEALHEPHAQVVDDLGRFLFIRVFIKESNIMEDRSTENEDVLHDKCNALTQKFGGKSGNVHATQQNAPTINSIEAWDQPSDGCLTGAGGAGKTSITGLVPRFYGIDSGRVLLGGVDVATLPAEFLRQSVAFVMQDVFIFSGTVLHNIALFDEHPDEEKVAEIVDYLGMGFVKS